MHKGRVLIVDDQEEILSSLQGILTDEGYDVVSARDGQEALHIVQSDAPDVVFLDIWIPGIDGMQTLRAIKRIDPRCSVIMMSGHGTIETAVKAIKLGATDYLEKPVSLEDVLHLVDKAVSGGPDSAAANAANGVSPGLLIGNSEKSLRLRRSLEEAAADKASTWIVGEEGTGKEFAARLIHQLEGKERSTLVKVRCSELDDQRFEEVLIGKEEIPKRQRVGKIAQAAGGTLLLVRVDRLKKSLRPRLVTLLSGLLSAKTRAGGPPGIPGRIVSTSVKDPDTLVRDQGFPPELARILAQRVIRIPELKERIDDIPVFVNHFLSEASEEFDREVTGIEDAAMARLVEYPWPGNVKELKIMVEHVVMTAPGPAITVNDLLIPGDQEAWTRSRAIPAVEEPRPESARPSIQPREQQARKPLAPHAEVLMPGLTRRRLRHQKTLKGGVVMYGQGLHTGVKTGLTLSPLPAGSGILFGHITTGGAVPAVLPNVESTELSTSLGGNGSAARTIEHLMAVFHVYGLTNVLVKISGEVPIMDGSALEFCNLVENAEIIVQDEMIEEVCISEPFELPQIADGQKSLRVEPSEHFEVEYFLDYPRPIGAMHLLYRSDNPEDFRQQIAPARTFGFVKDMRMLDEMGLAGGGRLSNVVLLDEDKVVNPPLRFPDEFVRHKILDIIGDFYLLGRPFRGKVIARQTGHTENIEMLKLINEKMRIL